MLSYHVLHNAIHKELLEYKVAACGSSFIGGGDSGIRCGNSLALSLSGHDCE